MDFSPDRIKQLSLGAFSSETVPLVETALGVIKKRYPKAGSGSSNPDTSWIQHAKSLENKIHDYDGELAPGIKALANGYALKKAVVSAYLDLLRATSECVQIAEIRQLSSSKNDISHGGCDQPTIIPFYDAGAWAFAVAYTDCVHWYDSRTIDQMPELSTGDHRVVSCEWSGPKHTRMEDSGVFMLLGVRNILQQMPHLSQDAADRQLPSFRAQLVIEILCHKLDPSRQELQRLEKSQQQESFFGEATYGMDISPNPADYRYEPAAACFDNVPIQFEAIPNISFSEVAASPNITISEVAASADGQTEFEAIPHISSPGISDQEVIDQDVPAEGMTPYEASSMSEGSILNHQSPEVSSLDDRLTIVHNLNQAVLTYRLSSISPDTSLEMLWSCVRNEHSTSVFYEGYTRVLFYDHMSSLAETAVPTSVKSDWRRMKAMQKHCEIWQTLCNLRQGWGLGRYALLLAVNSKFKKMSLSRKKEVVTEIHDRLEDATDPLESWLSMVRDMCTALIEHSLTTQPLMIDHYPYRRHEPMSDQFYEACTSKDPRHRMRLPRSSSGH